MLMARRSLSSKGDTPNDWPEAQDRRPGLGPGQVPGSHRRGPAAQAGDVVLVFWGGGGRGFATKEKQQVGKGQNAPPQGKTKHAGFSPCFHLGSVLVPIFDPQPSVWCLFYTLVI